jgi:chromate transporter
MAAPSPTSNASPDDVVHPTLREALPVWIKIGLLSFGGPAGQIALMHQELVDRRRWISDARFLHALNYCMVLPGPEAQQLATYLGWLQRGTIGGIIAGTLFVLPGALLMLAISYTYVLYGSVPWLEAAFYGLQAAVLALVSAALLRIGGKVLTSARAWLLAAVAFAALFVADLPLPLVMISACGIGLFASWRTRTTAPPSTLPKGSRPRAVATVITAAVWLFLWMAPLVSLTVLAGPEHILTREGWFFAKTALVTFGGAYAVLPYVAEHAVELQGWLSTAQMMDGLALAETTPGPLILVLQFVGFLGGWHEPGAHAPAWIALAASLVTLWATFMPGFLFIFAGAPWIEYSHGHRQLGGMMRAVSVAVFAAVLSLSLWFGWHAVVPEPGRFDPFPLVMGGVLLAGMRRYQLGPVTVVATAAVAGLLLHGLGLY